MGPHAPFLLIAEDSALIRERIIGFLDESAGIKNIATAADGVETLELIRRATPRVIILDIELPKKDGLAVLAEIKTHYPDCIVFIFTSHHRLELQERCAALGADGFFKKDRDFEQMIEAITSVHRNSATPKKSANAADPARFRQNEEDLDIVFWLRDPSGARILYINPAYEKVWGRPIPSLYANPRDWIEAVHPEDRDRVQAIVLNADPRQDQEIEYRIVRPDGQVRRIQAKSFPITDAEGRPWRVAGVARDITLEWERIATIREQARLINLAHEAIIVCDLGGKVQFWNSGAEQLYGWSAQEAVGQFIHHRPRGTGEFFAACFPELLQKGESSAEVRKWTRAGREVCVLSSLTLVRDDRQAPSSVLMIDTDITEKKELEARVLRAQRLEMIGSMTSGIAHDLNNILAPILISIPLLRDPSSQDELESTLEMIERSARRGADLVRQLLAFSRGTKAARVPFDARPVIQEVGKIARETFPKNIRVSVDLLPGLWTILGDASQLHQVLLNLFVNARDAMPKGGHLSLRVTSEHLSSPPSAQFAITPGPFVKFEVSDSGCGIHAELLHRIFEPFFTTKEPGQGTGLGLAAVLQIIKAHEGAIQVNSAIDRGTTVTFWLPANPEAAATNVSPVKAPGSLARGELILVVDDEPSVRQLAMQILGRAGYTTIEANNGAEALLLYTRHESNIKLVITDYRMPVLDGVSFLELLGKLRPSPQVILTTGLASDPEREMILNSCANRSGGQIIEKPYTESALLTAVSKALDQSR